MTTTSITRPELCLQMRNGAEIWIEAEKAKALMEQLVHQAAGGHRFVRWDGELFNTADVVGIFKPPTIEAVTRRKNGQWQCSAGTWHGQDEKDCGCATSSERARIREREEAIKKCGKCSNGFIVKAGFASVCECQEPFNKSNG